MISFSSKDKFDSRNLTMLCDFYELTMANGYFKNGMKDTIAVFDLFFRRIPDGGGFALFCGLEQIIQYLENLKFSDEDISYLKKRKLFDPQFLDYLRTFRFECDVWSMTEGTPIFPGEPIVRVRGPIIQAQFIETMLLVTINHQSLIATKTNRIVRAAKGRSVFEFGSRRAQGYDAANYGARAAYIAGAASSANTWSDVHFGIPASGTMAHSWVQSFDTELDSFIAYAKTYPNDCTLLVDTYNTLKTGVPNAIKVAHEVLEPMGHRLQGVRLDSGDVAYLSKKVRKMLDDAGLDDCKIVISNSLDEFLIRSILSQGAQVNAFGVGENLITARSEAVFGGVYKLVATYDLDGNVIPKIKISDNFEKITTPSFKEVWRLFEKDDHHPLADVITLEHEVIPDDGPYEIFDPLDTTKRKVVTHYIAKKMLVPIYEKGTLVYQSPNLHQIRKECHKNVSELWEEMLRLDNPHQYYVDLSQELWDLKTNMLKELRTK
ncbi:nicotinate phosphoribosyltransferase [Flexilinea flocculi]|uniref:Nicotinate phosphoribosyltransferase n=1 Tax=Flexilinea flocculi TaxID=1678840 RepID=A0A0S7BQP1_9CHLR|nr:nicotinate phosphoribosyltransferase [Flexilinea flocculi]GAP40763.1 putative nicotinate phosphoribosyltransferase [Flexilinea flocculi]